MKLLSRTLELRILKTLTRGASGRKHASCFGIVKQDAFGSKSGGEVYRRIRNLMRDKGEIPNWDELLYDPALSEETRETLKDFKKKTIKGEDNFKKSIDNLLKFRKAREMYFAAKEAIDELQKDDADVDAISDKMSTRVSSARTSTASDSWFTHFGGINKSGPALIKEALKPRKNHFIPTGIKAFDERNAGIPRGSFLLLGSTTSGGKSVMVGQLADNFAMAGARVCVVPLEMDAVEMAQRSMSRNSMVSISKVINPIKLSKQEKETIEEKMARFNRKIKKVGGLLSLYVPEEDMTIEDVLMATDPFSYDVTLIDYVALLKGATGDDQWKALGNITRTAKRHATMRKKIVGLAAQLNEEMGLKYSKTMAEHASNAWFWKRGPEELDTKIIKVAQPKSRNQESFDFYIGEDFEHMRFTNLDTSEVDAAKERAASKRNKDRDEDERKKKNKFRAREDA